MQLMMGEKEGLDMKRIIIWLLQVNRNNFKQVSQGIIKKSSLLAVKLNFAKFYFFNIGMKFKKNYLKYWDEILKK